MTSKPSPEHILQVGMGFWASKTLLSAVELELFTVLTNMLLPAKEMDQDIVKAIRARATLRAISEGPTTALTDPNKLLSQIGAMTKDIPKPRTTVAGKNVVQ